MTFMMWVKHGKTTINRWYKPLPNGWFTIVLPTLKEFHGISPVMSEIEAELILEVGNDDVRQ